MTNAVHYASYDFGAVPRVWTYLLTYLLNVLRSYAACSRLGVWRERDDRLSAAGRRWPVLRLSDQMVPRPVHAHLPTVPLWRLSRQRQQLLLARRLPDGVHRPAR